MLLQEQNRLSATNRVDLPRGVSIISFVMPIYNGLELTRACLRSLEQTVDLSRHEAILVDDASTDGTREFLDGLRPPYYVLHNNTRLSYAASVNRGVAAARGELLCLLNNDLIFSPGWLQPMTRAFDLFPDAGFVGNVQIDPRTGRYDHMGVVFGPDAVPRHFGRNFFFCPFRGYTEWKAVTAGCSLIKRSTFLNAGGLDEEFKTGSEDVDLCLRLGRAGRRHYVANDSVIGHAVSSSEGRHLFKTENEARLLQRWRPEILASLTPRDQRLYAINYILRSATQPWRYSGPKLWDAVRRLVYPQ